MTTARNKLRVCVDRVAHIYFVIFGYKARPCRCRSFCFNLIKGCEEHSVCGAATTMECLPVRGIDMRTLCSHDDLLLPTPFYNMRHHFV